MHITRFILLTTPLVFTLQLAFGQKFAHVNSADLVQNHPSVAIANTELEAFRKSVTDPFEVKTKAFQSKYQFFQEEMQAGTLSKVSAQSRQENLAKEQDALKTEGQQIQFSIVQKREQLLQPILSEVDSVLQVVAEEGHYTMIFDNSITGALLYATQTEDITEMVKARIRQGK